MYTYLHNDNSTKYTKNTDQTGDFSVGFLTWHIQKKVKTNAEVRISKRKDGTKVASR
jgi:hypothetical protein